VEVAIRRVTLSGDRQGLNVLDEISNAAACLDTDARAKRGRRLEADMREEVAALPRPTAA
jgi:hypothetical protein